MLMVMEKACSLALPILMGIVSLYNFARKRQDKYSKAPILALEDLDRTEIKENFLPCTIDPGRKHIHCPRL
ncbi:hypothetical protein BDF21DRAFT_427515 [Thamnidium elegans]|nr:hypothetical protein BDF21DRAFT_427515 [Thamnidium elegans]